MHRGGSTFAVLITLSLIAPIVSCGSAEEAPVAAEPTVNRRGPRASLLASTPTEETQPSAPSAPSTPFAPHPLPQPAVTQPAKVVEEAKPTEKEKPRDYSNELVNAVGGTEGCVKQRAASAALPENVSVSLEAYVLESGSVTRGYARSSHLSAEELECVKRRIEHARFAPAVEGAPRRVDATVHLTFKRPEPSGATASGGTAAAPSGAPAAMPSAAPAPAATGATNAVQATPQTTPQTTPTPRY